MQCVICTSQLSDSTYEGIQVAECPTGHGVFVGSNAMREILASRENDAPEQLEQEALAAEKSHSAEELAGEAHSCPQCGGDMSRRVYAYESGVVVDVCLDHGLWLDHGELQRIEAWYEGSEALAARESGQWKSKLDDVELQVETNMAKQAGALHWGPIGKALSTVSFLWHRKDDR